MIRFEDHDFSHRASWCRREVLRVGGLTSLGLGLSDLLAGRKLLANRATSTRQTVGKAKNCIILFLLGGPPQHSTWDPKPNAAAEIRGEFGPIATKVSGIQFGSILPSLSRQADKLCILRAVSTGDNAHSSSGYYMLTGVPHAPMNVENANPGAPNDWPTMGAVVRRLRGDQKGLPGAIRLPMHIFNTDSSVWPGQDAGFLGRGADPWLLRCEPASGHIADFNLATDVPLPRLFQRKDLLSILDRRLASMGVSGRHDPSRIQAVELLGSSQARMAFDLLREPRILRERYGTHHFGQSCLLARRLIEAGVSLVQVNWYRGPEEPSDAPCWDSHTKEGKRLKEILAPTLDQSFSALLEDLDQRGMLEETLVVCMAEFGRTPRFNGQAGRDHWGNVFSIAMAGGGIRGGQVYGSSDKNGAYPREHRVAPQDLMATILHSLGLDPHAELQDVQGRPIAATRGRVLDSLF